MSFILKSLLNPAALALIIIAIAWLASLFGAWKFMRRLLFLAMVGLGLIFVGPLPAMLSQPLAERFPPFNAATAPEPELIIVLGGMTRAVPYSEPGGLHPSFTARSERFLMGLQLARQYPSALLVFTGWSGAAAGPEGAEARRLADLAVALGIPSSQVIAEPLAQTTGMHPGEIEALLSLGEQPANQAIIVTSAVHMPRAMGVFRAEGWSNLTSAPADYPFPPGASAFTRANPAGKKIAVVQDALNEWLGLINYRLRGKIQTLLPAP